MRKRVWQGQLLLLLYQAVPIGAERDSSGKYRVTVGFGAGQWENQRFDCQGNLVSASQVPYSSWGAQLDAWPSPQVRVTGFGGTFQPQPEDESAQDYYGPFGGGLVAFEGHYFGLGAGVMGISGYDGQLVPSGYLRLGSIYSAHFRADLFPPTPVLGSTGWFRAGVGYRDGRERRTSGFLGIAIPPIYGEDAMFTGSVRLPVGRRLAVHLDAIVGPGKEHTQGGAAFGLRYDFGR
ncbi:MAG TPA: hypothetical protein VLV16_06325 [Gemmatimonadales bacterium]|nr:hypothetical protein [Gemmatimonadales bacterium]